MKRRVLSLILPIIAVVLEILPYGAVCNFAYQAENGSIERFRELYSYFSLIPFGYANFAPMLTAILSCVSVALLIVYAITGKRIVSNIAKGVLCASVLFSLAPLLFGSDYFSVVGGCITVVLAGGLTVLFFVDKEKQEKQE